MPHTCCRCHQTSNRFTADEYRDGNRGDPCICKDCQREIPRCLICAREFRGRNLADGLNQLNQHSQSHREKTVVCPVCRSGDRKFRTSADAVLHLESGACEGCRGKDNAHGAIFNFVQRNAPGLMSQHLMIENGSGVPRQAYRCQTCDKAFNNLSSLMQHQTAKHGGGGASDFSMQASYGDYY